MFYELLMQENWWSRDFHSAFFQFPDLNARKLGQGIQTGVLIVSEL